jgi:hypothetical protein
LLDILLLADHDGEGFNMKMSLMTEKAMALKQHIKSAGNYLNSIIEESHFNYHGSDIRYEPIIG